MFNYFKFYFVVYSEMIMVNTKVNTIRVTCLKLEVLSKLSWKIHFMSPQITQNNHHKCKFECPMQKMIIQFTFKTSKKKYWLEFSAMIFIWVKITCNNCSVAESEKNKFMKSSLGSKEHLKLLPSSRESVLSFLTFPIRAKFNKYLKNAHEEGI